MDEKRLRLEFEKFLGEWTGRPMDYHIYYETTGLLFAWECFKRAFSIGQGDAK
jgi:hypothetical protein